MSSHAESSKSCCVSAYEQLGYFRDLSASIMRHQEIWRGFISLECYNCSCLSSPRSTPFSFIHFIWQTRKEQINKSSKQIQPSRCESTVPTHKAKSSSFLSAVFKWKHVSTGPMIKVLCQYPHAFSVRPCGLRKDPGDVDQSKQCRMVEGTYRKFLRQQLLARIIHRHPSQDKSANVTQ